MNEYALISRLAARFPRSPLQSNAPFSSDSEVLRIGGRSWCLTIDEFSPEEDLFSGSPEALGWNLAVATLSDLLACGAEPRFFLQALVLPRRSPEKFASGLASGLSKALKAAGCSLCGGDLGAAENWRFTGFAMGPAAGRPIGRDLPRGKYGLWVTGTLGDANLAALTGRPTPRFELRLAEARALRGRATACVDTSGGLADALWALRCRSPKLRFEIDLRKVPYAPGVEAAAAKAALPPGAFLLGGAGEYELLFALPESSRPTAEARRIGNIVPSDDPGVFFASGTTTTKMKAPPCPRESRSRAEYICAVASAAKKLFGAL